MFQAGQQIGLYTLIKRIGRGGFGEVWLAERRAKFVTTKVAVKLPLEEQIDHEAIKHEAVLWEQANGHSNVLPIIDADEYDGQIVIVSEYAPDGSLDDLLQAKKTLPIKKAVEFTIGILSGLEFLHSRKIIHRDIKPANILLQGETPKLADFGISRVMKTTNVSMTLSGTPPYMAPEAFDRKRTAQTDIWSVGVILYQMLEGSLPFPHTNLTDLLGAIVRDEPEPFISSVPEELQKIVFKALAKKPEERYQSAGQMKDDLSDFLIRISQQNVQTKLSNKPIETVLPPKKLSQAELLAQTQASPTMLSHGLVVDTKGRQSNVTEKLGENLEIPQLNSGKSKSSSSIVKYVAPFVLLILLVIGGLYFYINKSKTSTNQNTNQPTSTSATTNSAQLMPFQKGKKYGYVDASKKVIIEAKYDYAGQFANNLGPVALNGKFGFIDATDKVIIPFKYDVAESFAEDVAFINVGGKFNNNDYTSYVLGGKWGVIDMEGNEVVSPKYDLQMGKFSEGLGCVEQNHKFGFIDKTGDVIVPFIYDFAEPFSDGLAIVNQGMQRNGEEFQGGGKYGFIDKSGNEVIPLIYRQATSFKDGVSSVEKDAKSGSIIIDKTGNIVSPKNKNTNLSISNDTLHLAK